MVFSHFDQTHYDAGAFYSFARTLKSLGPFLFFYTFFTAQPNNHKKNKRTLQENPAPGAAYSRICVSVSRPLRHLRTSTRKTTASLFEQECRRSTSSRHPLSSCFNSDMLRWQCHEQDRRATTYQSSHCFQGNSFSSFLGTWQLRAVEQEKNSRL